MNCRPHIVSMLTGALLIPVASASAVWSDDPFTNLPIADASGQQNQALVRATADGGAYISWLDNRSGGYDVYLQRLDAQGNEQWAHNGVLVADRGFSSTQAYGLSIDTAGNALLAFRDDRFTGTQITAAKVAPDGTLLWGVNGIQLTNTTDFVAAPRIAGTSDGRIVIAWTQGDNTRLKKLEPSGFPTWFVDTVLTDSGGQSLTVSDLNASDAGNVVVSMTRGFPGPRLYAQKVSAIGVQLWGSSPIAVFSNSLQNGNFPEFVTDGSGGAVFGWYGNGPLESYAQHILANGTAKFPTNGVAASTNGSQLRVMSPSVSYNAVTDEIFLFYTELNSTQSMRGLSGQKFDTNGVRQWTDTGKVLVPLGSGDISLVRNLAFEDGAMVFYADTPNSPSDDRLRATRVDTNGDAVWAPSTIDACSFEDGKMRLSAAMSTNGVAILAWTDERTDSGDIYAQNVNRDGSLGRRPADVNGDGTVSFADILQVIGDWGPCPPGPCPSDVSGDGDVGFADILLVIGAWDG